MPGDYTYSTTTVDPNEARKARITNAAAIIFAAGGAEKWNTQADIDVLIGIAFDLEAKVAAKVDSQKD